MNQNSCEAFLAEAQNILETILNERKSILHSDVTKEKVKDSLDTLTAAWNEKISPTEDLEGRDFELVFEGQKILLTLNLVYLVDFTLNNNDISEENPEEYQENYILIDHFSPELQRLCSLLETLSESISDSEMSLVKVINLTRKLKQNILLLTLLSFCHSRTVCPSFERVADFFSKEDLYSTLNKIIPKAYNYNLYMKYYNHFLQNFGMILNSRKLKSSFVSSLKCIENQFPEFKVSFEIKHETVMKELGMENFSLEDCCDRIESRASVLATEGPLISSQKMVNLWLLIDSSKFLTFDDNFMIIYVFSSEISVFHHQIMRIFYILNRIDEVIQEVGYLSYATPEFISNYTQVYTEMHSLFSKLVRALSKNYEIHEMESSPQTGKIKSKLEASALISAKLNELCIQLTCPLACLDSIIRLSLERFDIPTLFGDEEEKFIFTTQVQSNLVLHDFVAGDREKFAQFMVELYPCLERHFSRFNKSKTKSIESQGPNTALPPSYHLFASIKPPSYANINEPSNSSNNIQFQRPIREEALSARCCKSFAPISGFVFVFLFILIILYNIFA